MTKWVSVLFSVGVLLGAATSLCACDGPDPGTEEGGSGGAGGAGGSDVPGATDIPDVLGDAIEAACPNYLPDPEVKHLVSGTNGIVVDHCDENGDLVESECAVAYEQKCSDWECWNQSYRIDEVTTKLVECDGTCVDGACASRCPADGLQVTFTNLGMNGIGTIVGVGGSGAWSCALSSGEFVSAEGPANFTGITLTVRLWEGLCLNGNPGYLNFVDVPKAPVGWKCVAM